MTIHEIRTDLMPAEVIERARTYFATAGTPYAAFPERSDQAFLKLYVEVGEILIGAIRMEGWTWVRCSASRGAHLLTRFLTALGSPNDASQTTHRPALHRTRRSLTRSLEAGETVGAALPSEAA
jgi:hypothetical protein